MCVLKHHLKSSFHWITYSERIIQMSTGALRRWAYFFLISLILIISPAILNGKCGENTRIGWFLKHISPLKIFWPIISCFIPQRATAAAGLLEGASGHEIIHSKDDRDPRGHCVHYPDDSILTPQHPLKGVPYSTCKWLQHTSLATNPGKLPYPLTDLSVRSFSPLCSAHTYLLLASWP